MERIVIATNSYFRYNLYGEIEDFKDYESFAADLTMLTENDAVALHINSPGGRVDIGMSLVNSIQQSRAAVTAVIEAPSYSMASVVACACSNLIMLDNTYLMFHNYSVGRFGKGGELMTSLRHEDAHFNKLLRKVCYPFLTNKELDKISKDEDVYIYDDDSTLETRKARHYK